MGVIVGVLVGYALGSRAGPDAWNELEEAWHTIVTSDEVRDLVSGALAIAHDVIEKRAEIVAGILGRGDPRARLRAAA
jgi:hypothetical protein